MARTRKAVVNLINSWVGKNEKDGSYKSILNIYNSQKTKPRGFTMKPGLAWCATTVSAVAIALGYTDIIPVECSCYYMIKKAEKMGCWKEDDSYTPKIGDIVMYDWQDNGVGDNKGTPDHVGYITYVNKAEGYFVVTEGNYSKSVKKRTMHINGRYIRGFITPKYDADQPRTNTSTNRKTGKDAKTVAHEVIAGQWGDDYVKNLKKKKYNTSEITEIKKEIDKIVNTPCGITTATVSASKQDKTLSKKFVIKKATYMRNGAGWNKKLIVKIPAARTATCYGYYSTYKGTKWLLVEVTFHGTKYTGYISKDDLM